MSNNRRRASLSTGEKLMFLAGALFSLILITTAMMGGLFARYVARDQAGDSARVAAFDVKVNGPEDVVCNVTALHPGEIEFVVINDSEVAVSYDIRVQIEEQAGCGVLVILDKDGTKKLEFAEHVEAEQTYNNVGYLEVGPAAATHTLSFEPLNWSKITAEVKGTSKLLTQAFTVYIDVVQVD